MLELIKDILSQPAFLMGIMSMCGLIALRKKPDKIVIGTLKPILGYLMLSAGAGVIQANLGPLAEMIQHGFNITGVVPNNEAITSIAQQVLGVETMSILIAGLIFNLLIARFTRFKYVFLTGHHSFFMACLMSAVLQNAKLDSVSVVLIGGFIMGAMSSILPAICQKYTLKVTDGEELAMGHFGSLGYFVSAWVGSKVGNPKDSTENMKLPESMSFLRDSTLTTAITMLVFYLIAAIAAGPEFVDKLSGGQNYIIYAIMGAFNFAVGVTVVYNGVRMILSELIPAFQGISNKLIPNAVPAVDCAVFFTYAPTAVIVGFISSFIGGLIGMFILGAIGSVLIIPGLVPHFFCGASAGIYGNATGGKRGAIIGSFVNGLLLAFLPAMVLPVLGALGFANTTFGDVDFAVIGIVLGQAINFLQAYGVYMIVAALAVVLVLPAILKRKNKVVNNDMSEYE